MVYISWLDWLLHYLVLRQYTVKKVCFHLRAQVHGSARDALGRKHLRSHEPKLRGVGQDEYNLFFIEAAAACDVSKTPWPVLSGLVGLRLLLSTLGLTSL